VFLDVLGYNNELMTSPLTDNKLFRESYKP